MNDHTKLFPTGGAEEENLGFDSSVDVDTEVEDSSEVANTADGTSVELAESPLKDFSRTCLDDKEVVSLMEIFAFE